MKKVVIITFITFCLSYFSFGQDTRQKIAFGGFSSQSNEQKIGTYAAQSKEYKNNPYYQSFNFHRGMAIGFGVPGIILFSTPILFGTAPLVVAVSKYGQNWRDIADNDPLVVGISYYAISLGMGAVFMAIAGVNIILASWHLRKWRKSNSMALSLGYESGPAVALSYKF